MNSCSYKYLDNVQQAPGKGDKRWRRELQETKLIVFFWDWYTRLRLVWYLQGWRHIHRCEVIGPTKKKLHYYIYHLVNHWKSWIQDVPYLYHLLWQHDTSWPLLDHLTHHRMCQYHLIILNFSLELFLYFLNFWQSNFICPGLHSKQIIGSFFDSSSLPIFFLSCLHGNWPFFNILLNHHVNKVIFSSLYSSIGMASFMCDEDVLKAISLLFLLSSNS